VVLYLSLYPVNGNFPGEPGLAGFIGAKDDELVVTTGAIRRAKLRSNCHHQQTNTQLLQAECPSCYPTNSVKVSKH